MKRNTEAHRPKKSGYRPRKFTGDDVAGIKEALEETRLLALSKQAEKVIREAFELGKISR